MNITIKIRRHKAIIINGKNTIIETSVPRTFIVCWASTVPNVSKKNNTKR